MTMWRRRLILFSGLLCSVAFALEINTATEAQLDGLKGVGPGLSGNILTERHKQPFKDWADLRRRVKGMGDKKARQLSAEGLTVDGVSYGAAPEKKP